MEPRQNRNSNRQERPSQVRGAESSIPEFRVEWIENELDMDAINYSLELGAILAKKLDKEQRLTTSQIRNFYGELKRIQMNSISRNKTQFLLLHPKLAYSAKRAGKKGAILFKDEIIKAYSVVNINHKDFEKRFQNFCDLCEAILAFHRAEGGK